MTDMTAEQALDAVRNVLQRAYNSAEPVCCGRAGTECCGSPEPEWSEYDQRIMKDLQPVEEYLSKALTAPRVPEGWRDFVAEVVESAEGYERRSGNKVNGDWVARGRVLLTAAPAPTDETCPECGQTGSHREGCHDTYLIGYKPADVTLTNEGDMGQVSDSDEIVETAQDELSSPERNSYDKVIADQDAELANLRERVKVLEDALDTTMDSLKEAVELGAINDTLWATPFETLFDYIEEARLREGGA